MCYYVGRCMATEYLLYAAARVVSGSRKFDRGLTQLIHAELHWLDVPERQVQTRHDHATMSEQYCSSVLGSSLRSSLCDCIKATSAFCCQSSAGCAVIIDWVPMDVGPSLLPVRRRGTLYRNSCVILFTPPPSLHVYWRVEVKTFLFSEY